MECEEMADQCSENNSLEEALIQAIEARDKGRVRELLAAGARLPERSETPITYGPDEEGIKFLYEAGLGVDQRTLDGGTLLHNCALGGSMVETLLRCGADVNACDDDGETPLFYAETANLPGVIEVLVKNGADVNWHRNDGGTVLHEAAFSRHYKCVEALLRNGADVNARNDMGFTPLMDLYHFGIDKTGTAGLLIANGADVNASSDAGFRSIHLSAMEGDDNLIRLLIAAGAEINPVNSNGDTPLDLAIEKGQVSTAQLLRENDGLEGKHLSQDER
jgi:uncharacterized protein